MTIHSPWGSEQTEYFYELTPEKILDALEQSLGVRCTGRTFAHNSMENRVYELEIEIDDEVSSPYERQRIVKFYRPARWSETQILDEHRFLLALKESDIPVVAPIPLLDGKTLHNLPELNLRYTVFPKIGGRAPSELDGSQLQQLGRLLARMHNVGASMGDTSRIQLTSANYGIANLQVLKDGGFIPPHFERRFEDVVVAISELADPLLKQAECIQIHGDCHLGNLLWGQAGPFWVDFDDSVMGPPIQDLWLMILGRSDVHKAQMRELIRGYEVMREFDWDTLSLIEPLRGLRMIHFVGWTAKRFEDPAFKHAFPGFGTEKYWQEQVQDLEDQLSHMVKPIW